MTRLLSSVCRSLPCDLALVCRLAWALDRIDQRFSPNQGFPAGGDMNLVAANFGQAGNHTAAHQHGAFFGGDQNHHHHHHHQSNGSMGSSFASFFPALFGGGKAKEAANGHSAMQMQPMQMNAMGSNSSGQHSEGGMHPVSCGKGRGRRGDRARTHASAMAWLFSFRAMGRSTPCTTAWEEAEAILLSIPQ